MISESARNFCVGDKQNDQEKWYNHVAVTKAIRISILGEKETIRDKTQMGATLIYVLFKVAICLHLSPNNRARSLSTPMAIIVIIDAPDNAELAM